MKGEKGYEKMMKEKGSSKSPAEIYKGGNQNKYSKFSAGSGTMMDVQKCGDMRLPIRNDMKVALQPSNWLFHISWKTKVFQSKGNAACIRLRPKKEEEKGKKNKKTQRR